MSSPRVGFLALALLCALSVPIAGAHPRDIDRELAPPTGARPIDTAPLSASQATPANPTPAAETLAPIPPAPAAALLGIFLVALGAVRWPVRGLSNPNLEEERLRGGDIGLDVRVSRLSGQLNAFYNRVQNFVGSAEVGDIGDKFTVMTSNVAEIRSRGCELTAALQLTDHLSLTANYTFTDAEVIKGPLKGSYVEGAPENMAAFSLLYRAPSGLTLNPRARYVGRSFQDITNEAVQDAHWVFDFFAAYRVHKRVEIFVSGENIFNEQYVADGFSRGLGAPRQFSGGVRVSF